MKKQPRYLPSVTRLSEAIGLSRQWVQELMRLPDCPKVTKQGHSVAAWRAYITKRAEKIQSQAGQRAKLQIDLLQARLAREGHELDVASGVVRERIINEVGGAFDKGFKILVIKLDRLPHELAPQLAGLTTPSEIKKLLKARLDGARRDAVTEFKGYLREKEAKESNIVPFDERKVASA